MCQMCAIAPGYADANPDELPEGSGWSWVDVPFTHDVDDPEDDSVTHTTGNVVSDAGVPAELEVRQFDDGIAMVSAVTDRLSISVQGIRIEAIAAALAAADCDDYKLFGDEEEEL